MKGRMLNIRLKFGCKLISVAIKIMPKDWQDINVINNFMKVGAIKTYPRSKDQN